MALPADTSGEVKRVRKIGPVAQTYCDSLHPSCAVLAKGQSGINSKTKKGAKTTTHKPRKHSRCPGIGQTQVFLVHNPLPSHPFCWHFPAIHQIVGASSATGLFNLCLPFGQNVSHKYEYFRLCFMRSKKRWSPVI